MAKHHARLYYWVTCVREKVEVPASSKLRLTIFLSVRSYSVSSMSGCLSVFIRSNSVSANMRYLSVSGRIVPQAIRPYPVK